MLKIKIDAGHDRKATDYPVHHNMPHKISNPASKFRRSPSDQAPDKQVWPMETPQNLSCTRHRATHEGTETARGNTKSYYCMLMVLILWLIGVLYVQHISCSEIPFSNPSPINRKVFIKKIVLGLGVQDMKEGYYSIFW